MGSESPFWLGVTHEIAWPCCYSSATFMPRESLDAASKRHRRAPGVTDAGAEEQPPASCVPTDPASARPRYAPHHREEYGQIEYGGLPVIPPISLSHSVAMCFVMQQRADHALGRARVVSSRALMVSWRALVER